MYYFLVFLMVFVINTHAHTHKKIKRNFSKNSSMPIAGMNKFVAYKISDVAKTSNNHFSAYIVRSWAISLVSILHLS